MHLARAAMGSDLQNTPLTPMRKAFTTESRLGESNSRTIRTFGCALRICCTTEKPPDGDSPRLALITATCELEASVCAKNSAESQVQYASKQSSHRMSASANNRPLNLELSRMTIRRTLRAFDSTLRRIVTPL